MTVGRPALLFVSPVVPLPTGNGLAMRAGMMVEALARDFDIHLFVLPVAGAGRPPEGWLARHTVRAEGAPIPELVDPHWSLVARVADPAARAEAERTYPKPRMSRFATAAAAELLARWASSVDFAAIHVMRLYLAPLAEPFLRRSDRPWSVLDLDDDDAGYQERLAVLLTASGEPAGAEAARLEAAKYRRFADRFGPGFDRLLVASPVDASRLGREALVVPNGYRPATHEPPAPDGVLRLLFVGTLDYRPNADAARVLAREILPALRGRVAGPIRVDIVGGGAGREILDLAEDPDVSVHGFVEDLAPLYRAASVVVNPVRVGGGTRIKLLEAFAHGRPVVSTPLGAEGLAVSDGNELLLAETPEAMAAACLRLYDDPALAQACIERAARFVAVHHGPERIAAALAAAYPRARFDPQTPRTHG